MSAINFLNSTIGSCLIIILIAVDFLRKSKTDMFQRKLFIMMLASLFFAVFFDFIGLLLERNPGEKINKILYYTWSVYLAARNCLYYFTAVFVDYFAHGNAVRTRRLIYFVIVLLGMYCFSILLNTQSGFYFYISRENVYMPGSLYSLNTLLSYFPILVIFIDLGLITRHIKRSQIICIIVFVILAALGAALDIILRTTYLIWPCITAAMLYVYLFIIKYDSKTDSLTGMENRNSFNEYIKKLYSHSNKKEHTFIMFDIAHFKNINSALGHVEGDNALRDLSLILRSCIRNTDFTARLGGDEFIIVTIGVSDVNRIIRRINDAIDRQNKKQIRPYQLYISYSSGVYKRDSGTHIQDFLAGMDIEMNKFKELHHNDKVSVITDDHVIMN